MNQDEYYCRVEDFIKTLEQTMFYNDPDLYDFCGNPYFKSHEAATESANRLIILLIFGFLGMFLLLLVVFIVLLAAEGKIKNRWKRWNEDRRFKAVGNK